jgi:transglutaminase-like putative cysteine protease
VPISALPLDILPYLLPSRFVSSDRLAPFAEREFGSLPKGHQHVTAICSWLCENIDDTRGSSDEETTADESLLKGAGVCRDLAYLGIAFCRALNIPAPS